VRIKIGNAKYFKGIINTLHQITDELTFTTAAKGLIFRQMDPSHVSMIDFVYPKQAMDDYIVNPDEIDKQITFNVPTFLKVLKSLNRDTQIVLESTDDEKLLVKLVESSIQQNFMVSTLEPDIELPPAPKLTHTAHVKILTKALFQAVESFKNVEIIDIRFSTYVDKFVLTTKEKSDVSPIIAFDKDNDNILKIENSETRTWADYSANYLYPFLKALKAIADVITLRYSSRMPLEIEPELYNQMQFKFYLAPRWHEETKDTDAEDTDAETNVATEEAVEEEEIPIPTTEPIPMKPINWAKYI